MQFCQKFDLNYIDPSVETLVVYIQHLIQSFSSPKSVRNYFGAIDLLHKHMGLTANNMGSFEVAMMLRAASLNMRNIPNSRQALPLPLLRKICVLCDSQGITGVVVKMGILTAFFGFVRGSNVCAKSAAMFDSTRHLTRGDIHIQPPGLTLSLKWSKSLQQAMQPQLIPLVQVADPVLDIVRTFQIMTTNIPAPPSAPLLLLPNGTHLTLPQFRRTFNSLLKALGVPKHRHSLHALRRSGATASYKAGASFLDIKRHGAWCSSAFFQYIAAPPPQDSSVVKALHSYVAL